MNNNFAFNLKHLRQEKGLTQEQLGKLMNKDYSTIGKWENGSRSPIMEDVLKLSDVLNVDIRDLIGKDYRTSNIAYNAPKKSQPHVIYTDEETGLSVAFVSPDGRNWEELSKEEQEAYVSEAMDNLYEYKRNLKEKD